MFRLVWLVTQYDLKKITEFKIVLGKSPVEKGKQ